MLLTDKLIRVDLPCLRVQRVHFSSSEWGRRKPTYSYTPRLVNSQPIICLEILLLLQIPTTYRDVRDRGISMGHIYEHRHSWRASPYEDNTGEKVDKEQWSTEIPSPYMPWSNSHLEKNSTAKPGIEPGNSWSVTSEPSGRTKIIHTSEPSGRTKNYSFCFYNCYRLSPRHGQ